MKAFAHWLRRNMLVPLLIVLAGSAAASIYQSMAISAKAIFHSCICGAR